MKLPFSIDFRRFIIILNSYDMYFSSLLEMERFPADPSEFLLIMLKMESS